MTESRKARAIGINHVALEVGGLGLPDGDFKVGAWPVGEGRDWLDPPPADTVWYPGTEDWDSASVVEIRDASVVTDLVIDVR